MSMPLYNDEPRSRHSILQCARGGRIYHQQYRISRAASGTWLGKRRHVSTTRVIAARRGPSTQTCQLGRDLPGTVKRLRRIRTRTRFALAHCITSGLTPISRRSCQYATVGFFKTGSPMTVAVPVPPANHADSYAYATPTATATSTPTATATATPTPTLQRQRPRQRRRRLAQPHCHSATHADTQVKPVAKASPNSAAAPLAVPAH